MSNPTDLEAVQKLCDAATPGPWKKADQPFAGPFRWHCFVARSGVGTSFEVSGVTREVAESDAAFAAEARTLVPQMAEEIRELRAELAAATCFYFTSGCDGAVQVDDAGNGWRVRIHDEDGRVRTYRVGHVTRWTREEAIAHARRLAAGGEESGK